MAMRDRGEKRAPTGVSWTVSSLGLAVLSFDARPAAAMPAQSLPAAQLEALTPAEARVASLVAAGSTNREIAQRLGVSWRTVANQVASILRKRRLGSRFELMREFSA